MTFPIRVKRLLAVVIIAFSTVALFYLSKLIQPDNYSNTLSYALYNRSELPKIQGVVLSNAQPLANFSLVDHQNMPFNTERLIGKWHFITYGYTQCPDICPTTLFTLSQVAEQLKDQNHTDNTSFIFYSIDRTRDSIEVLASYIHYFDKNFIAIKASNKINQQLFEATLGIRSKIVKDGVKYQISHGMNIYLINPLGELQAVFIPKRTELGVESLTSEQLIGGYQQAKLYYQNQH